MAKIISPPTRFISVHSHTDRSINDAMGTVFDHMDSVRENGMDVFVNTDHGTMAAYSAGYLYQKELRAKGIDFKYVGGCEMYVHPDLDEWAALRKKIEEEKKDEKKKKVKDDVDTKGLVIEDESASKRHVKNPLNRRHHLVVLPKSEKGLSNLFTLVSRGFNEGYYRYPRIDYKMLKEHSEDLIVSSACMAGPLCYEVFGMFSDIEWTELSPDLLDDPAKMEEAMRRIGNVADRLIDAVGEENFFAEIQFNAYGAQHLVNRAVLEFAKRNGLRTVATCDSHYPRRDLWKAREIYKALGWLNYKELDPSKIPQSRDELMCELYPKNATEMWESYHKYCDGHEFYDDEVVKTSIENGWHIAHDMIGDIKFDESPKLPQWIVPKGKKPVEALLELCKKGLEAKGLAKNPEYIERLKKEITVMHHLKTETYFLLMNAFMDVARKTQIIGPGRGCFVSGTRVKMADGLHCPIDMISKGDRVLDADGESRLVENVFKYEVDEDMYTLTFENGKEVTCTPDHKFLTKRGWVMAKDLDEEDDIVEL